jgi:hypothetical protein
VAALGVSVFAVGSPSASACCVAMTEAERVAASDVIFEGTALEGATESGIQRFRVTRYLKGSGPGIVGVNTGQRVSSGLMMVTSVSINPDAETEWRIFGQRQADGNLITNNCLGSARLPLPPLAAINEAPKSKLKLGRPAGTNRLTRVTKKLKAAAKRTARRARGSLRRR